MFNLIKTKIIEKYLLEAAVEIRDKKNGFRNIIIRHPGLGIKVLHPLEERGHPEAETDDWT